MTAQPMRPDEVPTELIDLWHKGSDAHVPEGVWPDDHNCNGCVIDMNGCVAGGIAALIPAIRAMVANEIAAEADEYYEIDVPGTRDADLPGLAGNSYWRAACSVNGLRIAERIAREGR